MRRQDQNNKSLFSKFIGPAVVLLISAPEIFLPLLVLGGIGYLGYRIAVSAGKNTADRNTTAKFDDCPQPLFCFHKDKGEHHVQKGKEIDPWDRPDIDISKYQRNR